ncbi:MAG: hypothetical protein U1D30_26335 [Planctomycetota bacterium]
MQELKHNEEATGRGVLAFLRGTFLGMLGVAAIAVWAINLDIVFSGNGAGPVANTFRVILCDAIPFAILCAIYRNMGKHSTVESTVQSILATIFWFPRMTKSPAVSEQDVPQADKG